MFCSKTIYSKLISTQKRALQAVCFDLKSDFNEDKSSAKCSDIYEIHLRSIAIETYKDLNKITPELLDSFIF